MSTTYARYLPVKLTESEPIEYADILEMFRDRWYGAPDSARVFFAEDAMIWQFTVPRAPVPKARPRVVRTEGGGVNTFTPAKTRSFELDVAACAHEAVGQVIEGPVAVHILAVLPRPKRLRGRKHPDGLMWAPVRPDADNIRKSVLDGLHTVLIDDAQVVAGSTLKVYAERDGSARTMIQIREMAGWEPISQATWWVS